MIKWNNILELGKVPDVELAKKLDVSPQTIFQARKRRNIKALNPSKKCSNINWDSVPLGQKTDQHIADILNCSGAYVLKQRRKKNIPAFGMLYRTHENEASYYEESIMDMWLHDNNIKHKFQFQVGKYRVDWLIPDRNEIWEFLGMWDHRIYGEDYRKNFEIKEKFLIDNGYVVRRIYRDEMNKIKKVVDLNKIYSMSFFECRGCHRTNIKHQAKGLCGMCITRTYKNQSLGLPKIEFLKPTDSFVCEDCGSIERHKRVGKKCHKCYCKSWKIKKKSQ